MSVSVNDSLLVNAAGDGNEEVPRYDEEVIELLGPADGDNRPITMREHLKSKRKDLITLSIAVVCAIVILFVPILTEDPAARRCLALTLFVAICWSTSCLPLFVTALTIPVLVVFLSITPYPATVAATNISRAFFDPVILLFLSGLTFAAALDKYKLSHRLAILLIRFAGTKPIWNLAAFMGLSYFLSMWVTNVAASVVAVSMAKPIIDQLEPNSRYAKGLLFGIATACNVGGMSTPIASPQNAIAVFNVGFASHGKIQMGFLEWMGYAVPFSLVLLIISWLFLYKFFKPEIDQVPMDKNAGKDFSPMGMTHYFILVVVAVTVLGWCTFQFTENVTGNLGIIGVIPVVSFFACGILGREDYEKLAWSVLTLIGGGVALGVAATQSKLLTIMSEGLASLVGTSGDWIISAAFVAMMAVVANFLPHSVVGIVVLPVVAKTGVIIEKEVLVVLMAGIMNSGASCLPVSSFPNANSFACRHSSGSEVLTTGDYLKAGVPLLLICAVLLLSLGYALFHLPL